MVSLKSSSIVEFEIKKICFNFAFFEESSRFKVSWEHGIFGSLLFTFTAIFARINILSIKNLIQIYISRHKMHQIGVPNR